MRGVWGEGRRGEGAAWHGGHLSSEALWLRGVQSLVELAQHTPSLTRLAFMGEACGGDEDEDEDDMEAESGSDGAGSSA